MLRILCVWSLFWVFGSAWESNEKLSLQLPWHEQFQFAGYYMAKEKGFYASKGIDLEIKQVDFSSNMLDFVLEKEGRYGIGHNSLLLEYTKGKPLVALASLLQSSPFMIVVKDKSAIKTEADFKDKKILGGKDVLQTLAIRRFLNPEELSVHSEHPKPKCSNIQRLLRDEVDAIITYRTNELYTLNQQGIKYRTFSPQAQALHFYSDILYTSQKEVKNHTKRALAFKEASLMGWRYAFEHIEESVSLLLQKYNEQNKTREMLIYEAQELKKLAYYRTNHLGLITKEKIQKIYDYYKELNIIKGEHHLDDFLFEEEKNFFSTLTKEEQEYLKKKKEIKLCIDPYWMPFESMYKGEHIGLSADYMKIISEKTQCKITLIKTKTRKESLEKVRNHHCDMLSILASSKERESYLQFTQSYVSVPVVFTTRNTELFIHDVGKLGKKKVAVSEGYLFDTLLKEKYPLLEVIVVKCLYEGLQMVERADVFAYVDNLASSAYEIQRNFSGTLHIAGRLKEHIDYKVAVFKEDKILQTIMDKAIESIPLLQRQEILSKWSKVENVTKIDYSSLALLLCIALLIILAILYRQHLLKKEHLRLKKIHNENARLKEQTELAILGNHDGIWDWNILTDEVYFSPAWKKVLGYEDGELENYFVTWEGRLHPEDKEKVLQKIERHFQEKGRTSENKHRLRHKDGHWIWIYDRWKTIYNDKNQPIRMIGTHTDISKEMMLSLELSNLNKSLEEKIALATHDLRVSQKQAKLGSWKLNIPNQTLTWSDETYEIFELDKHTHIANYENFLLCIHPEDREKVNKSYLQSLKSQEEYSIAHRLLMPDGRIKYVKEHCETSFNEEGEGLISIGTIQDVSAEYLANEALRNKDEMLFKQSRLAQMGEMLSMIAHQWRQPLSAMSAKTNTLIFKNKMERYDSDDFEKGLFQIAEYTQHLSETIDDFRDFFKQDKLQEESTCEEILDSVWEIIFPSFNEHRITLSKGDMCDVLVPMYTNEIRQVVLNILKNAEDALVENKIEYPFVSVTCVLGEYENILLSIEDNAGGIDEVIIETLFDPYVTTKQDKDGTGLGLYMSKIMIEEHGGGILSAQNTLKGSIFSISLPLHSKLTKS